MAEPNLKARGVAHVALFGSVARSDDGSDSDSDVMIEIDPDTRMDVYGYVGIVHAVADLFPTHVDVAHRLTLKDHIRAKVERDAVDAF